MRVRIGKGGSGGNVCPFSLAGRSTRGLYRELSALRSGARGCINHRVRGPTYFSVPRDLALESYGHDDLVLCRPSSFSWVTEMALVPTPAFPAFWEPKSTWLATGGCTSCRRHGCMATSPAS